MAHGQPLIPVDVEPSVPVDELPLPTNSINEQPAPTNVRELVPPTNSQPALTSLQSGFTEVELATPGNIVQEASIAPSWAIHKAVRAPIRWLMIEELKVQRRLSYFSASA